MDKNRSEYYRELTDVVLLAGQIMISSGAETHRVEDMLTRILKTTGFSYADAFVLPTGITVTLSDEKEETLSVTRRVLPGSNNLARVCRVNTVSRAFCAGKITLEQAREELEKAEKEHIYPIWLKIIGTIIACGAFTLLFGGSFQEGGAALLCGCFVALISYYIRPIIGKDFLCDALCSAVMAATALTLTYFSTLGGLTVIRPQFVIVGSMMPLVPGVALTNAIRDLLQGDFISACARIAEAFMIAAAVAVGVGAGILLGKSVSLLTVDFGFSLEITRYGFEGYLVGIFAAFFSAVGFNIILEVPRKFAFFSALTAAVGWTVYLTAFYGGVSSAWSSFAAAAIIEFLSYILARILKAPVTAFLICGIIPLVPGAGIYRAAYGIIFSGTADALASTLTTAGAIALGIIVTDTFMHMISDLIKKRKARKSR